MKCAYEPLKSVNMVIQGIRLAAVSFPSLPTSFQVIVQVSIKNWDVHASPLQRVLHLRTICLRSWLDRTGVFREQPWSRECAS